MDKLGEEHIAFLRQCAEHPNKTFSSDDIPEDELKMMADQGLLIRYGGVKIRYAASKAGVGYAKTFGESPEIIAVAEKYVMSKGYSEADARKLVTEHGASFILKSQTKEMNQGTQRGVKVPTDAFGRTSVKPIKST